MWAIFRFDLRVVTAVIFATASYVSIILSSSVGLFDVSTTQWPIESLIATAYMAISVLVALSVYALVEQARQQMARSKEARESADRLMQATGSFFWIFDVASSQYKHMSDTETGYWTDHLGMRTATDDWLRFVHPDERGLVEDIWQGMKSGVLLEPYDIKFRLVNEDGNVRWDQHVGIPLLAADGTVDRYVGMIFDITNEESLRLEEQNLRDVLHESDKLNTVGTLAAGLAHDWNNLLLVLSMEADRLREMPKQDTSLLESIKVLDQVVEEGQETTKELLGLARRDVEPSVPINLHREVHKAAELLARALPNRISLRTNYVLDSALIVNCRVSHVHQIVMNLGLNARDAIGDGAGTISITVDGPADGEILGQPCSVARLVVADDGSGMPQHVVEQIFEPLFSTKLDSGGTGLGLAVVKNFVTEMGGAIDVDSTEGDGTTVTISMPVADTDDGQ